MDRYNPKIIEPEIAQYWKKSNLNTTVDNFEMPKKYILEFFPYPSGAAMHVGHVRNYTIGDATARYWKLKGYNVLHPMGWDAFGLPAENYAIKTGISPREAVAQNVANFKQQLDQMGFSYDWNREINSTDPGYYKWTQYFFTLLFNKGLAYQKESLQWWCDKCKTVLANEQVVDNKCWRHEGAEDPDVIKKPLRQWFFKITDYADRLIADIDKLDWSEGIKAMQVNWIGKKTGIEITYRIDNSDSKEDESITVFTTRPDTNFGATFIVIAPEHPLARRVAQGEIKPNEGSDFASKVQEYINVSLAKSDVERAEEGKTKTGVFTGLYAHNTLNGKKLPIWVSDFVLSGFGTGAVVGVPGHDLRDFDFAKKFNLEIIRVVKDQSGETGPITTREQVQEEQGEMINSEFLDGQNIHTATQLMMNHMEKHGMGKRVVNYKIRDWLISRQRYWGAPIPIVWVTEEDAQKISGEVLKLQNNNIQIKQINGQSYIALPVPEISLPVILPEVESFEPDGSGKGPLARNEDWLNVWFNLGTGQTVPFSSPKPGTDWVKGIRETDTQDGFACSSWYFNRFADPKNDEAAFSKKMVDYWLPVDTYIGGAEHAVMHLLYARMWTKIMFDEGMVNFDEPFTALKNQGMILAPDGRKMSKSYGNTIQPGDLIADGWGADSIRVMEMFIGPYDQTANWSTEGLAGCYKFLDRFWRMAAMVKDIDMGDYKVQKNELVTLTHQTIQSIDKDFSDYGFNTIVAKLMTLVNKWYELSKKSDQHNQDIKYSLKIAVKLLAPIAPHIAEKIWHEYGNQDSIFLSGWPQYDQSLASNDNITIMIQVNGKIRAKLEVGRDITESDVKKQALAIEAVKKYLTSEPNKIIYVPGKIVSIVV